MTSQQKRRNLGMRRFFLDRKSFPGGTAAQGIQFYDGTCVLRWFGERPNTAVYDDIESLVAIHVHEGDRLRWYDPCCFTCGQTAMENGWIGWCSDCGSTWDPKDPAYEPDPTSGHRVSAGTIPASAKEEP